MTEQELNERIQKREQRSKAIFAEICNILRKYELKNWEVKDELENAKIYFDRLIDSKQF
jgi:hypothetical protein